MQISEIKYFLESLIDYLPMDTGMVVVAVIREEISPKLNNMS
jgi:hypothetical protein